MFNKNDVLTIAKTQLSLDYNFNVSDLEKNSNIISETLLIPGRRIYDNDGCFLKILCFNGSSIITADKRILPWCKEKILPIDAAWLFMPSKLRKIDSKLKEFGHEIADIHQYYLPDPQPRNINPDFEIKWYEAEEIKQFSTDSRIDEAFAFNDNYPDVLAVAAFDGDVMIGIAGASKDCETMWQIGINVFPEYQGKRVATTLVTLLKEEILRRGIVPFYSTVESHFHSQNVAINSGFFPAFAELYSKEINK